MAADITNSKRFFPVVHVESPNQALQNVQIAVEAGVSGVFLIDHSYSWQSLQAAYREVRRNYPSLWIGLNYLDLSLLGACYQAKELGDVQAIWSDERLTDQRAEDEPSPEIIRADLWRRQHLQELELFGSVAFKGQHFGPDIGMLARTVAPYVTSLTTSGPGTGMSATVQHVRTIREAAPDVRLALASGVSLENVDDFLPLVDDFLVASSIGRSFNWLDPLKVAELADRVLNWTA